MEQEKNDRKKYWLKLDKDFLKSSQMKVIKAMSNGKDYIIFYLSLMLESVETVGHLRFTSLVPYNAEMLSAITETNIDIVRSAIKIFCELGLMKIFDDGTIFIPEVPKITGKECESAERVRRFREKQKLEMLQCNNDVTKSNTYIDKDKDKNKDKKIYGEFKNVLLTDNEYKKLEQNKLLSYIEKLSSYIASKGKKYKSHYATILNWARKEVKEEKTPNWFNKTIEKEKISKEDEQSLKDMLKDFE